MNISGGMLPQWETLCYARDSIVIARFFEGAESTLRLPGDPALLERLWSTLVGNDFPTIDTRKEELYDRGGTTIAVEFAGLVCQVSDAGLTFIVDRDLGRWQTTVGTLCSERERIIARYGVPVSVGVDTSLRGHRVSLSIGWHALLTDSSLVLPADGERLAATVLPGDHVINACIDMEKWTRFEVEIRRPTRLQLTLLDGVPAVLQID